jgi:formate transporter
MPDTAFKHLTDAYAPSEIARRIHDIGVTKARLSVPDSLALAVLAGAFIALGAAFATTVMTGSGLGYGPTRFLGGVAFSLGLILVVIAGAELFTGNNLVAMAWASRAITTGQMVRNWALVLVGNFLGAVGTVALVFWSRIWTAADGSVGLTALRMAATKCELGFGEAFARGILCNALVCLAVWLCQSGRSVTDRILAVVWPVAAFVALGLEHVIANLYFIPLGILLKSDTNLLGAAREAGIPIEDLTISGFAHNLLPVTLGNMVGGTLLVAGIYWFVYLRGRVLTPPSR